MILHILNKSCILASAEACDRRTQSAGPATLTFGTSANIFKLVRCRHSHGYASAIVSAAAAIAAANPELDPQNLRPGQTVAVPLGFPVVPTGIAFTSQVLELTLTGLLLRYPFLGSGAIGSSARGLPLWSVSIGEGETQVFYNAAHHANEWITTPLLLTFLEEYCLSLLDGDTLYGYDAAELYRRTTLSIVPMVDPDGVDLVTGYLHDGPWYQRAREWAENYPSIPFPEGWKANLNGVDLNLQYPAGWEEAKKIKESMGFTGPAPRDYVGTAPLTQPEALAVYRHTLQNDFRLSLSYHTQGLSLIHISEPTRRS